MTSKPYENEDVWFFALSRPESRRMCFALRIPCTPDSRRDRLTLGEPKIARCAVAAFALSDGASALDMVAGILAWTLDVAG